MSQWMRGATSILAWCPYGCTDFPSILQLLLGSAFGLSFSSPPAEAKGRVRNAMGAQLSPRGQQTNWAVDVPPQAQEVHVAGVKIFYGSQTGTAKRFAKALAEAVLSLNLPVEVFNMGDCDPEDCLSEETSSRNICVFLVATYTEGQPPESAAWFCKRLEEAASDFRVGKSFLQGLRYAVFGLGNSAYVDHYNTVGRRVDRWLWMLSASRIMTRAEGDCNVAQSKHGSIEADFEAWKAKFLTRLQALCRGEKKPCSGKCKKGKCKSSGKQSKASSDREDGTSEHENPEIIPIPRDPPGMVLRAPGAAAVPRLGDDAGDDVSTKPRGRAERAVQGCSDADIPLGKGPRVRGPGALSRAAGRAPRWQLFSEKQHHLFAGWEERGQRGLRGWGAVAQQD